MRRWLPLVVLLTACVAYAQPEVIHHPGGGAPVEGIPVPLEFGGTGSTDAAFTDGDCVEVFTEGVCAGGPNAGATCGAASVCPGGTCGLKKLRSAGDPCGTGSGGGTFACASGEAVQSVAGGTPVCVTLLTPQPSRTPELTATPVPSQTPWACGAGAVAIGLGAAPTCAILPTPDGAGPGALPTAVAFVNQGNTFTTGDQSFTNGSNHFDITSAASGFTDGLGNSCTFTEATAVFTCTGGINRATDVACGTQCVDISSETNLTASSGVTLTGDALTADLGTSVDISSETNLTASSGVTLTGDNLTADLGTSVDLASEVTGTLPAANGGTGVTDLVTLPTLGVASTAPTFLLDDTDIANTGGAVHDGSLTVTCTAGPVCNAGFQHNVSGSNRNIIQETSAGLLNVGSTFSTNIVVNSDGTGDTELTLPFNSVQLAGGAGVSEVVGILPKANGGIGGITSCGTLGSDASGLATCVPTPARTAIPIATFTPPGDCGAGKAYRSLTGGTPVCETVQTPGPTYTPGPTPTFVVKEGGVAAAACQAGIDLGGINFDVNGSCQVDLTANVMTITSSVQPSQLGRLAGNDSPRTFGNADEISLNYDSTLKQFSVQATGSPATVSTPAVVIKCNGVSGSGQCFAVEVGGVRKVYVDGNGRLAAANDAVIGPTSALTPTPTSTAATPTPTLQATSAALTPTPTVTASPGLTATPTPQATARPHLLVDAKPVDRTCFPDGASGIAPGGVTLFFGRGPGNFAAAPPGDTVRIVYPKTAIITDLQVESYIEFGKGRLATFSFERAQKAGCTSSNGGNTACAWSQPPGSPACSLQDTGGGTDVRCDTIGTGQFMVVDTNQVMHLRVGTLGGTSGHSYNVSWMVCLGPPAYDPF